MAKLVYFKNHNKYAIQRGFFWKEYLNLTGYSWYEDHERGFRDYCLGSQEQCEAYFIKYKKSLDTKAKVIKKLTYE